MKILNSFIFSSLLLSASAIQAGEACTGGLVPSADEQTCVTPDAPDGYTLDTSSWDVKFVDYAIGNFYGCNYYGYGSFIDRNDYTHIDTVYQQHVSCGSTGSDFTPLDSGKYSVEYAMDWPTEVNYAQQMDNTRVSMFSSLGSMHQLEPNESGMNLQIRDDSEMTTPETVISCDSTGGFECPDYKIAWTTVSVKNIDTDQLIYRAKQAAVIYFYDPTLPASNVRPVDYEFVSNHYNRATRLWTMVLKVSVSNFGDADASNVSAVWNEASIPAGIVVHDNSVSWTDPDNVLEPSEVQVSGDTDATFSFSYVSGNAPDSSLMTWDITLTDSRGTDRVIRNVAQ